MTVPGPPTVEAIVRALSLFSVAIVPGALYLLFAYVNRRSTCRKRVLRMCWPWHDSGSDGSLWYNDMLFHKWLSVLLGMSGGIVLLAGDHFGVLSLVGILCLATISGLWSFLVAMLPLDDWLDGTLNGFWNELTSLPLQEIRNKYQGVTNLAREIGSDPPPGPAWSDFPRGTWSNFPKGMKKLKRFFTENIQHLEEDLNHMAAIRDRCVDFGKRHHEAVKMVAKSHTLAEYVDLLMSRFQAAVLFYVPKKAWIDFLEAMDVLEEELRRALQVAEQNDRGDSGTWRTGSISVPEAHLIIGSAPDWSWPDIQNAYRNKVKQVHPDRAPESLASNDEYIKWVNRAWQTLQATQSEE